MTGCMPVTSPSLISISTLDTTLFSDLTGVLKMSLTRLSGKIGEKKFKKLKHVIVLDF